MSPGAREFRQLDLAAAFRAAGSERAILAILFLSLLVLVYLSVAAGDPWLSLHQVIDGTVGSEGSDSTLTLLIRYARLPRVTLAMLVGGALATAGLLMQTLSRNPLATPSVLGIGNGANFGLVLAIVAVPSLGEATAVAASFLGAAASAAVIALIGLSGGTHLDRDRLVVGGTILGALEGSLVVGILFFQQMHDALLGWTLGRLIHVDWAQVYFVAPMLAAGLLLAAALVGKLEAFRLGRHTAQGLGVRVGQVQGGVLLAVVLLAGGSIAAAGPVAFVGLIVPHLMRSSWFPTPRLRLAACLISGALLTGAADLLSRLTSHGRLIPLGIWTMAIGAAFFISLSLRGSRGGRAAVAPTRGLSCR